MRYPFRIARHHVGKPLESTLPGAPRSLLVAVMVSFLATAGVDARAENPVALVVEVVGETAPRLELFSELSRNDRFDLIGGATVEFLHYATCKSVVVRGGRLSFSERSYRVRAGEIVKKARAKCPQVVRLKSDTDAGGLLMRSTPGQKVLRLTPRPRFIVVGERSGSLVRGRVVNESAETLDFPVVGRRFEWPDDMPPLAIGRYRLELAPATGTDVLSFPVEIVDEATGPALVVLRAD